MGERSKDSKPSKKTEGNTFHVLHYRVSKASKMEWLMYVCGCCAWLNIVSQQYRSPSPPCIEHAASSFLAQHFRACPLLYFKHALYLRVWLPVSVCAASQSRCAFAFLLAGPCLQWCPSAFSYFVLHTTITVFKLASGTSFQVFSLSCLHTCNPKPPSKANCQRTRKL